MNIENVKTNKYYFEKLLKQYDILCIQEHWMASFESNEINRNTHCATIKCFDDDNPSLPTYRPRGHAGVAILWKNEIDRYISILPDGSNRVQVIQISTKKMPVTIINTYMPTDRSRDKSTDYCSVLDEVHEITAKYMNTSIILWVGDINASFVRLKPTMNDLLLKNFCEETGFIQVDCTPNRPTYHHFLGGITSQIDHFLQLSSQKRFLTNINIITRDPTNLSSHDAVCAALNVDVDQQKDGKVASTGKPLPVRTNWRNIDIEKYSDITDQKFECLISNMDGLPLEVLLQRIHDIMIISAQQAYICKKRCASNKKHNWPPVIISLVKQTKIYFAKWKAKGSPCDDDPATLELKLAKKALRSAQRQIIATKRREYLTNIMDCCDKGDQKFFSLIRKQRHTRSAAHIQFSNDSAQEPVDELQGWVNYFSNLSTPKHESHFDEDYYRKIEFKKLLIHDIAQSQAPLPAVSEHNVKRFINSLKNNKAPDIFGITSEHLKYSSSRITFLMTKVLNEISQKMNIPDIHKIGALTPVPKKGKSAILPDSYRRITVTPTTGKIVEKLIQQHSKPAYTKAQNPLQRGFTEKASSTNTELLLTEVIAEAKDNNEPLFIQFLDARKAFDVVWHNGMLCSLHDQGITGPLWCMHASLYEGIKSCVKWKGEISTEVIEDEQGLRQGGLTSADSFKTKENPLLYNVESSPDAYHIGDINVGAPTCADDIALCSSTLTGAKVLNDIAVRDSCYQRYAYSSTKSKIMIANPNAVSKMQLNMFPITLLNEPLEETEHEVHLGIHRTPKDHATQTIIARITTSRRAVYAMMGAGLHGLNGLNPSISMKLIETYILPRLLHGLDGIILTVTNISQLEKYYRTLLRQIQHLPQNTANEAVYLLMGALPIEGHLDIRTLSLFNRVALLENSKEWEIIRRQLAMKDVNSNSWAVHVRKILWKYGLPSAFELFLHPLNKQQWKITIKKHIYSFWERKLKDDCEEKISLHYLNLDSCTLGMPHSIYSMKNIDPIFVHMNSVKTKVLVMRYNLADSPMAKSRNNICPVCSSDPETLSHFLFECDRNACGHALDAMCNILRRHDHEYPNFAVAEYDWYIRLFLDPSFCVMDDIILNELNIISTKYIFSRHNARSIVIGTGSRYVKARKLKGTLCLQ